jgi:hypothetical protein
VAAAATGGRRERASLWRSDGGVLVVGVVVLGVLVDVLIGRPFAPASRVTG